MSPPVPNNLTRLPKSDDDSTRYRPAETASAEFRPKRDGDTDLVTPEQRALWEGRKTEERTPINLRPVLSENGKKGPVSGAQWPHHDIGDLLGEGGMAAVYLARRRDNGRLVALKILPARYADDAASRKRFEREAQISQTIDSRHVIKVWNAGRYGPLCYLEMEFVDGTSLGEDIKRRRESAEKPFTNDEVIELGLQAADGLMEAAKLNLVHRDIKPGNLMRTRDGVLKVADFGIVKVIGEEALTMAGTAMGTPSYMSPEQGRGDEVDARADMYSLGVVLYELLTLKQPFEEATADALIYQHHFVEPKLITDLVPGCTPALQAVVFKCLQKAPDNRYADAVSLIRDLNLLKGGHEPEIAVFYKGRVTTGADEALARHGGGWRRWWKHALVGVASLILMVALGVWWLLASRAQADSLRGRLTLLDTPQAIPVSADADLKRLRNLVGERDQQVARWTEKLQQAEALRQRFAALPDGPLEHAQVATANELVTAYQLLCGTNEPLVTGWRARLDEAAREQREVRTALTALDRQEVVPKDQLERLLVSLAVARRLLSASNADVIRWAQQLEKAKTILAELRTRLALIDTTLVLTASMQRSARDDLARWNALMGAANEDGLRWAAKVKAAQEQLTTLRQTLAQLDSGDFASLVTAAALANEWSAFITIADPADADAVRWNQRLALAKEQRDALAKRLVALDQSQSIERVRLDALQADLAAYRSIAGDDVAARRWQLQLTETRGRIATLRQVLTSLAEKEQLSQAEQQLLRTTVASLTSQQALEQSEVDRINQRLARDEANLVLLSQRLAVLDRQEDVAETLRPLLDQFERLALVDDPRRLKWRNKLDEVVALRRRLAALDEHQPVAKEASRDLQRLLALVGAAPADVRRWRDFIATVSAHKTALATVDSVGSPGENAAERLERLRKIVGDTDVDVQRWQGKLERITALRGRLENLDRAYVLPTTAADDVQALRELVGEADHQVVSASARVLLLTGPGRPAWASDFGRDEHGIYADMKIWKQVQRFRFIPAGEFKLGSGPEEIGRAKDEASVAVRLTRSLWLAESECTQDLWAQVMLVNPSYHSQAGHPVERVSWDDAQAFFVRLTQMAEKKTLCRLPTEAEWEYAVRAGATGRLPGHDVAGGDDIDRMAVHAGNAGGSSRPVRGRQPNRLGLYDTLGNVWEWCQDSYAPYPQVPSNDPLAHQGTKRVIRGGSWEDASSLLRVADRHALAADVQSAYVGLRIAIDVVWTP
jgi:formylglycine-generating enzyme required for sulfatase activity